MRLVSGASTSTTRAPAAIFLTTAPSIGISLHIDADRIFFAVGQGTNGPISNVDTDDAMHTYRLEHDGSGNFTLFHDDAEILNASAYESASDNGPVKRFAFGEGSNLAYGVSEWGSVRHDFLGTLFKDSFEAPPVCEAGEIESCTDECVPDSWLGDGTCNAELDCEDLSFYDGDCVAP